MPRKDDVFTYSDGVNVNRSIPRTMTEAGLHYLGRLAKAVPEDGVIVEIGPLYGSSTWVLANNSHPSVSVFSIDTWEPQEWITRRLPDALDFSIEAFKYYTRGCRNVTAIQGWSPAVVAEDWSKRIDLFFDDATHGDPGFSDNVNFFLPFVRNDGVLCGDDFASGWPDIIRVVSALAERWNTEPEVCGRVWALLKEGGAETDHSSVAEKIGPWSKADVSVRVTTQNGQFNNGQPRMWTGRLQSDDPMVGIGIYSTGELGVDGTIDVHLADGTKHTGLSFGQDHAFEGPIVNLAINLDRKSAKTHAVSYQCCEIVGGDRTTVNTKNSRNGSVIDKGEKTPMSAIRVEVLDLS